jgi:hypothetical protein
MQTALSVTLIVYLAGSARPATAQNRFDAPTSGSIARAVTREAVRLAAGQPHEPVDQDWSRVGQMKPGTEIVVTVKGSPPAERHCVAADEADLTVLNLTDPTLPAAARDVLRDMAANHPDYFALADKQSFVNGTVRVAPDGVSFADRKVADLGQVVETIARNDIDEIKTPTKAPRDMGTSGPPRWLLRRSDVRRRCCRLRLSSSGRTRPL